MWHSMCTQLSNVLKTPRGFSVALHCFSFVLPLGSSSKEACSLCQILGFEADIPWLSLHFMRSQLRPLFLQAQLLLFLLPKARCGHDLREAFSVESIPPFCKKAVKRLRSPVGFSQLALWETCCDPFRFDVYGHRSVCFKGASTWEVQNCCAALQKPWHFDIILQKVVTSTEKKRNKLERHLAKVRNSLNEFGVVTYHKTGTFVATQLLGYNLQQGPLAALLLGNSSRRWEAGLWENASIIEQDIEGISTWMRESSAGRIALLYNPPEHDMAAQRRLYFTLAAGKLIHFIRRPSVSRQEYVQVLCILFLLEFYWAYWHILTDFNFPVE